MRNNIELNKEEYNALLEQFYTYFEDGYKFEEFLKIYLEKIGLEEVYVTKRSGDGGIDLTAIRKGIGGLSNAVDEPVYVQAKRYAPSITACKKHTRNNYSNFQYRTHYFTHFYFPHFPDLYKLFKIQVKYTYILCNLLKHFFEYNKATML
jgi:hypothetical protein